MKSDDRHRSNPSGSGSVWAGFPLVAAGIGLAVGAIAIAASVYRTGDILIILCLAVLFSIFLTHSAEWLSQRFGIRYTRCVGAVVFCLLLAAAGVVLLFSSRAKEELKTASKHFDMAASDLKQLVGDSPMLASLLEQTPVVRDWAKQLLNETDQSSGGKSSSVSDEDKQSDDATSPGHDAADNPTSDSENNSSGRSPASDDSKDQQLRSSSGDQSGDGKAARSESGEASNQQSNASGGGFSNLLGSTARSVFSALGSMVQTSLGLLLNVLIIFFVGLFLSLDPAASRDGVATFAPPRHRPEVVRILDELSNKLWKWLIGRLASMVITGTGIGLCLAFLGVPMAFSLGVITCLLTFIPNIGGAIALGLASFVALPCGLDTVAWVIGAYLLFQLIESYLLTPFIQQYQVDLPPALLIGMQAVLGTLLGLLGAMIASPAVVVGMVLHKQVYRKIFLKEPI